MADPRSTATRQLTVDVVIPVLNEAHVLEKSVNNVRCFLEQHCSLPWTLVIVDNGSRDGTDRVAQSLSARFAGVQFLQLPQPGRGRALRFAWMQSKADIVCYMDVDLSTDLAFLPPLLGAISEQGYDIAIGSRLLPDSRTKRCFKREFISRLYNLFLKLVLSTRFSDAQCGFKAVSREVVERIVPQIEDQSWFFDTELLVLAEKQGHKIKEIPVVWMEDDDSRVKILRTAWDDIRGVLRLCRQVWSGRLAQRPLADAKLRQS